MDMNVFPHTKKPLTIAAFFLLVLAAPNFSLAQVVITEIMYDAEGADAGREWVEIHNSGGTDIDLADWRFLEADTNHKLTNENGATLAAGSYAIIADDASVFAAEWPSVSALVLDSSFSLKNTGEYIALKDPDGTEVDGLFYAPLSGADGNGASLQKDGGTWVAGAPTPGAAYDPSAELPPPPAEEGSGTDENTSSFPVEPQIFADAGEDRAVIVGADTVFDGKAFGLKKEPLVGARFMWNFGDGATKEGRRVLYAYRYPGTYIVFLEIASGEFSATDSIAVRALEADIAVSSIGDSADRFIELHNRSNTEIDLSRWILSAGGAYFTIPENTRILAGAKVAFPEQVTGLTPTLGTSVALLYPNGTIAVVYGEETATEEPIPAVAPLVPRQAPPIPVASVAAEDPVQPEQEAVSDEAPLPDLKDPAPASLSAAPAASGALAEKENNAPLFKWLLALFGVTFTAALGVIFIRRTESSAEDALTADDITIVD